MVYSISITKIIMLLFNIIVVDSVDARCNSDTYTCTLSTPCHPTPCIAGVLTYPANSPSNYVQCAENGDCSVEHCSFGDWDLLTHTCPPEPTVSSLFTRNIGI